MNNDYKSRELIKYLNLLIDLADLKAYYNEMGGEDQQVVDFLESYEENAIDQHSRYLKTEISEMLRDPMYKPYMERLLNEYKKVGLVDENEAKVFEGELRLQKMEEEMKNARQKKIRGVGRMNKFVGGLDKQKIAGMFNYAEYEDNPIDILLTFKNTPADFQESLAAEKDSLMLLQKRQELQIELTRLKLMAKDDEEKRFLIDKFGKDLNMNLDILELPDKKKDSKLITELQKGKEEKKKDDGTEEKIGRAHV